MSSIVTSLRTWSEMVKLAHSIFALPFALMATFLAGRNIQGRGLPWWSQLGLIIVCMVSARSVAMTFNRIVDAQIDARNPRTSGRPLPAGKLTLAAAWIMLGLAVVTFGIGCLGFYLFHGNAKPLLLSGPVLTYLCGYSFTKRFTSWSHFYLGSAIALSPVAAWIAIHPQSLGLPAFLLAGIVLLWIGGFDIIYACQDIEVDRCEGLYSLPSRLGPARSLWIARGAHALVVVLLVWLGLAAGLGLIYGVGVAVVAALLLVENALVHPDDYSKVNLAFFTINGIVSIVLAGSALLDMFISS